MKKTLLLIVIFLSGFLVTRADWNHVPNNLTERIIAIASADTAVLLALGESGNIFISNDCGHNWEITFAPPAVVALEALYADKYKRIAVGDQGKIFMYNGTSWVEMTSATLKRLNAVHFAGNQHGYAVGEEGTIIKTVNGGTTWTPVASPTTQWLTNVFVYDQNNVKIVGDGGLVISTANGGQTWDQFTAPGAPWLGSVWLFSPTSGWFSGTDGILYLMDEFGYSQYLTGTTNGIVSLNLPFTNYGHGVGDNGYITKWNGTTWQQQTSPTNQWLNGVTSAYNTGNKSNEVTVYSYACGDNGTLLSTSALIVGLNDPVGPSHKVRIFPNPANQNALITGLGDGETAEVIISGNTGQVFNRVHLEYPTNVALPVSLLPDGFYVVSIKTDRGNYAEKLIIRH